MRETTEGLHGIKNCLVLDFHQYRSITNGRICTTIKVTIPPMEFAFRSCRVHWLEIEFVYPLIRGQSRQRDDCDYDEDGASGWEERNRRNIERDKWKW